MQSPVGVFDPSPLDRIKSPGNSRPPTPPTSRPQTPTNAGNNYNSDSRRPLRRNEELASRGQDKRDNNQRKEYTNRRFVF